MEPTSAVIANRQLVRFATRAAVVLLVFGMSAPAFAQQMVGGNLLTFAANFIIAPLGIFAIVVALAGSIFRPDMVRSAGYAALICAVLFFVIKSAPAIVTALRN